MTLYLRLGIASIVVCIAPMAVASGISVGAGNSSGQSTSITAFEPPGPNEIAANVTLACLPTPTIVELHRWGPSSVDVKYEGAAPTFQNIGQPSWNSLVQLKIFRQFADGEWETVFTHSGWSTAGEGEWTDDNAPIAKPVRYAAITTILGTHLPLDAGSNALPPKALDYIPGKIGLNGIHSGSAQLGPLSPLGFHATGVKSDYFNLLVNSPDGVNPGFLSTNPFFPVISETFHFASYRGFTEPQNDTELSAEGYFIRGPKFTVTAEAHVHGWPYESCILRTEPEIIGAAQPSPVGRLGNEMRKYTLTHGIMEIPFAAYKGEEKKGFEEVTYFAAQHLGFGSRRIEVSASEFTHSGPFDLTEVEGGFELLATTSALNTDGLVTESVSQRPLKVVTLPPRHWRVGLYRTDIYDLETSTLHEGVEPPDAVELRDKLNEIIWRSSERHVCRNSETAHFHRVGRLGS